MELLITLKSVKTGVYFDNITPKYLIGICIQPDNKIEYSIKQKEFQDFIAPYLIPGYKTLVPITKYSYIMNKIKNSNNKFKIKESIGNTPDSVLKSLEIIESFPEPSLNQIKNIIPKNLWDIMHPHQHVVVMKMAQKGRLLLYDEMGSGKSLSALACMFLYKQLWPVLIICPSGLRENWYSECKKWIKGHSVIKIDTSKDIDTVLDNVNTLKPIAIICSYSLLINDTVRSKLIKYSKYIIFDESHSIKNRDASRTKCSLELVRNSKACILLTGTPFNYPNEMYTQIYSLYPQIYPRFFHYNDKHISTVVDDYFAERYCKPQLQIINNGFKKIWTFKGYKNHDELNYILSSLMIRRRKEDILKTLPPKSRHRIVLNPINNQDMKEIKKCLETKKDSNGTSSSSNNNPYQLFSVSNVTFSDISSFMKAFRATCKAKINSVISYLEYTFIKNTMVNNPTQSTLIFFHHDIMRESIEELFTKYSIPYICIYQKVSNKKRKKLEDEFQKEDSKYRIALLSIKAAGTGLTFTKANTVIFTELLFGPDDMLQAEDRVHRLGQKAKEVHIYYLISPGTTDDINMGLTKKKRTQSELMMGNNIIMNNWKQNKKKKKKKDDEEIQYVPKIMK